MGFIPAKLVKTALHAFEIQCPSGLSFRLGQYFLASAAGCLEALPAVLFPSAKIGGKLIVNHPPAGGWQPGMALNLRGPLGRGFHFPEAARRVAIIESGDAGQMASFFQFWMEEVMARGGEIVYYGDFFPAALPTAVEGLPLDQAGEAWKWAEYLVADVDLPRLEAVLRIFKPERDSRLPEKAEVLVRAPMTCGGTADCGLCAVMTAHGPRLACKEGPVFPLHTLARRKR